jgi:hypothetical protein
MRALAHGVPLLILPLHRILDQLMVGMAVATAGAGRVLPKTASADEIRSAVQSLLQDPSYQRAAEVIGARLRSRNGAIAAADELESLLKTHRALRGRRPSRPRVWRSSRKTESAWLEVLRERSLRLRGSLKRRRSKAPTISHARRVPALARARSSRAGE